MSHSYKNILVIISDKYQSEKCGMSLKNQWTDTTVCKEGQNYSWRQAESTQTGSGIQNHYAYPDETGLRESLALKDCNLRMVIRTMLFCMIVDLHFPNQW